MNLTYHENYWDDPELKREFIKFLIEIHDLDLSLRDKMGYWDNEHRPFSYFENGKLISSTCLYSMDMIVQGKRTKVAQISGVGTLPGYRRKGLSGELNRKAMNWARDTHDFFFLFADDEAFPLYKSCGFRTTQEYKSRISVSGRPAIPGAVKLDTENKKHLKMIYNLASDRSPVSNELGVFNEKLFMFWCMYYLKDNIYHIPDLECLVLYKRENWLITVYDIVGKKIPSFSDIYPFICDKNDTRVEFLFMTDKLNLNDYELIRVKDNGTHLFGDFPLENSEFIFPFTAHA